MRYLLISLALSITFNSYSQLMTDSVLIEGHYRSFHFYKPGRNTDGGSLMFVMHGSGGNGLNMMQRTAKLESIAANENLLIVYPNGYRKYWNECRKYATSDANKEYINENAFFTTMIDYFHTRYGIDKKRVVAAGMSGGGHMAYKLGLTMPDQVSAIASIVANMPDSASCDCTYAGKPLPVLIINGTEDKTNPYNGGEMYVNNASYGIVRSTDNTFSYWSLLAGYNGTALKRSLPDTDPSDRKTIERYSFNEDGKPAVTLLKVIGGGHDYPNDIDTYLYTWEFFKAALQKQRISTPNAAKKVQVVETACGECQFGLAGHSCDLAVRINGKSYFVDGTDIDSHGDAHAKDGFCNAVRKAEVQGEIKGELFVVTYFKLLK
jgi:polyhydroxybutyrate depolymerase